MTKCKVCGNETRNAKFCCHKCYVEAMRTGLIKSGFAKGYAPFNKGLDRETSALVDSMYAGREGSMKGKKQSEFQKLRASQTHKGKKLTVEQKAKMLHSKETDPDWYDSICRHNKDQWKNPEYVKSQMRARNCSPNKFEMYLDKILQDNFPNVWRFVGDGQLIIQGKCPDFIDASQKKIIELFGDYWHRYSEERERMAFFKQYGYDTLIIWTHDFDNKEEGKVLEKVSNFCQKGGEMQ